MSDFWTDFWNFIWLFFWGFAMVAYLFAVFTVIGDLFRDHSLNGWWKALWIACIIFLPFLTVLVYVITRGSGLVERLDNRPPRGVHAAAEPVSHAASAPGVTSRAGEIRTAKDLLDAGVITHAEFEALKTRALAGVDALR